MIRGFCVESRLQPECCSDCGYANSESDDARFEHEASDYVTVGADLDFAACRIGLAPRPDVGASRRPIGSHQMVSI
jgi:hypothetical protein